jgi:phosphatidylserine decarboxylase
MAFAKECWPFFVPVLTLALILVAFGYPSWALVAGALALALLAFFRIPARPDAGRSAGVLSPANGKVLSIDVIEDPLLGDAPLRQIVIFLSVFNVHVQRAPTAGKVVTSRYRRGRKLAAFDPRAGEVNEQHLTVLERSDGDRIGIRQIAGLVARRVVSYLEPGQEVTKGELIGVIKFGSRVDLLIPVGYHVEVEVGHKVVEGRTLIAHRAGEEP